MPEINGAIVVMDPHTGRVLAMSGGFSFASSQFDRAMQAKRQPGSSFKPFVYAAALDNGYTPASEVLDAPVALPQGPGLPLWTPKNYEHDLPGPDDAPARARTVAQPDDRAARQRRRHGQDRADRGALRRLRQACRRSCRTRSGADETTLMRMTTGYSEFVNGGKKIEATLIDRVQDRNGKTIYRHDTRDLRGLQRPLARPGRAAAARHARSRSSTRARPIRSSRCWKASCSAARVSRFARSASRSAGKTGTSNDAKDTWFIGFSPDLACGVFVGFDNPRSLGPHEQGATAAAPIFRDFMEGALENVPPTPFRVPPGIDFATVNRITGAPAAAGAPGSILEAFKAGTEPTLASDRGSPAALEQEARSECGPGDRRPLLSRLPPRTRTREIAISTHCRYPARAGSEDGDMREAIEAIFCGNWPRVWLGWPCMSGAAWADGDC